MGLWERGNERNRHSDESANYKKTSALAGGLITQFAGMQISASESLREATYENMSASERIRCLERAKFDSTAALGLASNRLEYALAFSQLTCATAMIALVEMGIENYDTEGK